MQYQDFFFLIYIFYSVQTSFIHKDGKESMLFDQENEIFTVNMEVDYETCLLENITLNQYLDVKPPERMEQEKEDQF
jgi:hypothetical protein